ncbi:hypothetical protein QBC41DRAFT_237123, partial [Cercophora samala]
PLLSNNKGAIKTVYNTKHYRRTKHIFIKFYRVKEVVATKIIVITYLSTD